MTREEALKNAIEALTQWSQGTVATAVVLAAIPKLELTTAQTASKTESHFLRQRSRSLEAGAMDRPHLYWPSRLLFVCR